MLTHDRIWGAIPPGFKKAVGKDGSRMIVRDDQENSVTVCACRDFAGGQEASRFAGRARLKPLKLPGGETALIRSYYHGGLFRGLTGDVFFSWPPRPFRELGITEELRRRGVPTVEVYAALVEPIWGPFYRGRLITRELRGAQDFWAACQSGFMREAGPESCLRAVARSIRALHDQGVYHGDLNLKNILVRLEPKGVGGYIIDFDKAKLVLGSLPPELAKRNLNRLLRSVRKLDPNRAYFLPAYWDQLVNFYHEANGRGV
jgi:tRNA A-37 threonylcarbamoyl transferase component Bud32